MNGFDEISYKLGYFGDSDSVERAIVEAIAQLPEDIRVFSLERCAFVSVGRTALGITNPGRIAIQHDLDLATKTWRRADEQSKWLVLLEECVAGEDLHSLVAHEIAHAWLGHDRVSGAPADCEEQAARLVSGWGFTGVGADGNFVSGESGTYEEYLQEHGHHRPDC